MHAKRRLGSEAVLRVLAAALTILITGCETPSAPLALAYTDRPVTVGAAARGWSFVATGGTHSCGIRTDGVLHCWGNNASAQLGVDSARGQCGRLLSACEAGPRAVTSAARYRMVSAGERHTCALTQSREIHCWGENVQFQTGVQGAAFVRIPTLVAPGLDFLDISAGSTHSCAVRTNGVVYCWGEGRLGALGRGDTVSSVVPSPIVSTQRFVAVRSGRWRSCAIALNASVWCWGAEWESSQGATDFFHQRLLPQQIADLPPVRDLSVSGASICAVTLDGQAFCWESNAFGQLGRGEGGGSVPPVPVAGGHAFRAVSAGILQTCGTTGSGHALCWGNNSFGQLGVPRPGSYCGDVGLECSPVPIGVFGRLSFSSVATGLGVHSCGVTTDTSIVCWGLGGDGQLGDGFTRERQSLPVGVLAPSP